MTVKDQPDASRRPAGLGRGRMEPLKRLPVFLNLEGRPVLLAGNSDAAAWKADLLIAAGASVRLFAPSPEGELAEMIAYQRSGLFHQARSWEAADLSGMAIALLDSEDDDEAEHFRTAARQAGVPCNVIDRPAFCDFQFGAIINRSPVVIGIATEGAAPVLGQAVRRRIEAVLPPALAEWAQLAKTIRFRVQELLEPGQPRRAFWDRFAELVFQRAPNPDEADHLIALAEGQPQREGHVTLVGAGPGDAELLTLKAVRALQAADVILCDDLVPDEVLELGRREARRITVGKRGGKASCKQDDINNLMVKLALEGERVVRLKAGDPMIFGRAGEELEILASHGISADVVPGISAGIALASSLGLSLTHRDLAHSVRFVTGHSRKGELPSELDWKGLADPETTLIVYMGGRTAPLIADRLMREGLPAEIPVVIASSVSQPNQSVEHTTLGELRHAEPRHPDHPTLLGIGKVFGTSIPN